jgi:hypothetical protein
MVGPLSFVGDDGRLTAPKPGDKTALDVLSADSGVGTAGGFQELLGTLEKGTGQRYLTNGGSLRFTWPFCVYHPRSPACGVSCSQTTVGPVTRLCPGPCIHTLKLQFTNHLAGCAPPQLPNADTPHPQQHRTRCLDTIRAPAACEHIAAAEVPKGLLSTSTPLQYTDAESILRDAPAPYLEVARRVKTGTLALTVVSKRVHVSGFPPFLLLVCNNGNGHEPCWPAVHEKRRCIALHTSNDDRIVDDSAPTWLVDSVFYVKVVWMGWLGLDGAGWRACQGWNHSVGKVHFR